MGLGKREKKVGWTEKVLAVLKGLTVENVPNQAYITMSEHGGSKCTQRVKMHKGR